MDLGKWLDVAEGDCLSWVMLEDDYTDVLKKAMVGRGVELAALAEGIGVEMESLLGFAEGRFSEHVARRVAQGLGLNAEVYARLPKYLPEFRNLVGVEQLVLPFGPWSVNAWWIDSGAGGVLFDMGQSGEDLRVGLGGRLPVLGLVTHHHGDHVGGLDVLRGAGVLIGAPDASGSDRLIHEGDVLEVGRLKILVHDVSGHAQPAVAYEILGYDTPILVVGDAIFAGSIGKCATPELYQLALRKLRELFEGRDGQTVILPGHGPATTLGEERAANPFL